MGGMNASNLAGLSTPSAPTQAAFAPQAAVASLLEGTDGLAKFLSPGEQSELRDLGQETDPQLFVKSLSSFAARLETTDKAEAAARIYAAIVASGTEFSALVPAQQRLDAILGKGAFGGRAEFLLRRFAKDATDPKTIVPMVASSAVYGLARSAVLSRLLAGSEAAWYAGGYGARLTASTLAFAAEVPTFALSSRALRNLGGDRGPDTSLGHDFASAALTLGLLKGFSFAGQVAFARLHGVNEMGLATRWAGLTKFSQPLFSQGAMFTGLLAAHRLEEQVGLREHVDGATTVTDTLAAMLSLGAGGRLAESLLGPRYAAFQTELNLRTGFALRAADPAPESSPAAAKFSGLRSAPWLARAAGLSTFLVDRLAMAQEAGSGSNASFFDPTVMTLIATGAVGGLLFWGGKKIRENYVAPKGRIFELQGFRAKATETAPKQLLKEVRKAETYLREAKGYDRVNDEAIAVEAANFLHLAIPRLKPEERLARVQALWDHLLDANPHNSHLMLRVIKETAVQLDAKGLDKLLQQGIQGLNYVDVQKMLSSLFLVMALLPRFDPARRHEILVSLQDGIADREKDLNEHLDWVQKTLGQLRELKEFMGRHDTEEKQKLRQKIRVTERSQGEPGSLIHYMRGKMVESWKRRLEDYQGEQDADLKAAFEKHLSEKGEPGLFWDPFLAMDYGDKLQEMFQEKESADLPAKPLEMSFRGRLPYLEPYLKDGVLWIRRLRPQALLQELRARLIEEKGSTRRP